ncbi:MAG: hypothetical protein IPI12_07915 [Ignavibacteriales bacterium]|nr:hypothetical protein [Ignavibacteriales bacterium]
MVKGLKKFEEHFEEVKDCFVLIGGSACYILLEEENLTSRKTNDIDLVLIMDEIDNKFAGIFWDFIKKGGYSTWQKNKDKHTFFRFHSPRDTEFPDMIELFSRNPNMEQLFENQKIVPVGIGDVPSLSAILLDEEYYNCLLGGKKLHGGLYVLTTEYLILFKMKAYLDLKERKLKGETVDSDDVKKHKMMFFRLVQKVGRQSKTHISANIISDVNQFLEEMKTDIPDVKNLKLNLNLKDALTTLAGMYLEQS